MKRSLKFFYFGYQCPHNTYLLARIKTIAWKESVPLHLFDLAEDSSLCDEYDIYVPTMLIVNDDYRWCGPFSEEDVVSMLEGEDIAPKSFPWPAPRDRVEGDLIRITSDSVLSTCEPCLQSKDMGLCRGKSEWVHGILEDEGTEHLGYLHFVDGRCVGGAEYLPSTKVPYQIPDKRVGNAFLTCSYASDESYDYRTHPLKKLIAELGDKGFDTLSIASAMEGIYPNGPADWFEGFGFEDAGHLKTEEFPTIEIRYLQLHL